MTLKELKYTRFEGETFEWGIQGRSMDANTCPSVSFGQINLIVGKNATGKSKSILSILQLAELFSARVDLSNLVFHSSRYEALFQNEGVEINYLLEFKDGKVLKEVLDIGGVNRINRIGSKGDIFYEDLQKNLSFETDDKVLAITRRDKIQHSYLESLYQWGKQLFFYKFASEKGRQKFIVDLSQINEDEFKLKDSPDFVAMFKVGKDKKGDDFVINVQNDMKAIGYPIAEIGIDKLKFHPIPAFGINVKEDDLNDLTDQIEMSSGMFSAFSLIVQINYL